MKFLKVSLESIECDFFIKMNLFKNHSGLTLKWSRNITAKLLSCCYSSYLEFAYENNKSSKCNQIVYIFKFIK